MADISVIRPLRWSFWWRIYPSYGTQRVNYHESNFSDFYWTCVNTYLAFDHVCIYKCIVYLSCMCVPMCVHVVNVCVCVCLRAYAVCLHAGTWDIALRVAPPHSDFGKRLGSHVHIWVRGQYLSKINQLSNSTHMSLLPASLVYMFSFIFLFSVSRGELHERPYSNCGRLDRWDMTEVNHARSTDVWLVPQIYSFVGITANSCQLAVSTCRVSSVQCFICAIIMV